MSRPHRVAVTRSGDWWAIEFPDHPNVHSQAKTSAEIPAQAAEALSVWLDEDVAPEDVQVVFVVPEQIKVALDELATADDDAEVDAIIARAMEQYRSVLDALKDL